MSKPVLVRKVRLSVRQPFDRRQSSSAKARSTSEVEDEPRLRRSFAVRGFFMANSAAGHIVQNGFKYENSFGMNFDKELLIHVE